MRNVALNARDLSAIVEALRLQISSLEQQLAALSDEERNDDARADLVNDCGYLTSLAGYLQGEYQAILKNLPR